MYRGVCCDKLTGRVEPRKIDEPRWKTVLSPKRAKGAKPEKRSPMKLSLQKEYSKSRRANVELFSLTVTRYSPFWVHHFAHTFSQQTTVSICTTRLRLRKEIWHHPIRFLLSIGSDDEMRGSENGEKCIRCTWSTNLDCGVQKCGGHYHFHVCCFVSLFHIQNEWDCTVAVSLCVAPAPHSNRSHVNNSGQ